MSREPKMLDGEVLADVDPELERLRSENRTLKRQVADAETEATRAREDATRALSALRRQLGPLYRALQLVFGELDAAGVADEAPGAAPAAGPAAAPGGRSAREMAMWDDWKTKLPPGCAKIIDALLLHPDLSVKQLRVSCRMGENSVYQATSRLGQAGLIAKVGGRFSLKQL
jgi:hypothetical protein